MVLLFTNKSQNKEKHANNLFKKYVQSAREKLRLNKFNRRQEGVIVLSTLSLEIQGRLSIIKKVKQGTLL
jgi:hypothetical protein